VVADAPIVVEEAADEAPAEAEHEVEPEVEHEVEPEAPVVRAGVLALRLESERGSRSIFEVTKSGATIGRGPESTIQLADLSVSRKHARIAYRQGAYWLSDLGSMGGTWVDGSKLAAPRRVATGQTIDIGVCRLTVISAGAEEEPAAARTTPQAASRR
jgi:pSer/pThr/pTyr-binding forkhead associated (FHA) protein